MSEPIALFGLKLTPGEVYRMDVFRDFRITNVAFGETVKGNGRSVVKVHVTPSYGHPMTEDDMDSDEDEDEDDEDEEDDEEKEEARALKVYEERSFVLAALTPGKIEQVAVNLQFTEDEEIGFSVTGDNEVDLLGNYIAPFDDEEPSDSELYDSDDDSVIYSDDYDDEDEYDSDEMAADGLDAILAGEDSEDEDEDEEIGSPQIEELELEVAPPAAAVSKKRKAATETAAADVSMASSVGGAVTDSELAKAAAAEGLDVSNLSKAQRKRLNKKLKSASGDAVDADVSVASSSAIPAAAAAKVEKPKAEVKKETSKTKTPSGLIIEVKKPGSGAIAKKGQKASMRYIGKLTTGKVFDSNTKGKPFSFKLGRGEVIKAWEEGVVGMKIGEERRLTAPPSLAYGASGAPPEIPKNATLVFDIKLVDLK